MKRSFWDTLCQADSCLALKQPKPTPPFHPSRAGAAGPATARWEEIQPVEDDDITTPAFLGECRWKARHSGTRRSGSARNWTGTKQLMPHRRQAFDSQVANRARACDQAQ